MTIAEFVLELFKARPFFRQPLVFRVRVPGDPVSRTATITSVVHEDHKTVVRIEVTQ